MFRNIKKVLVIACVTVAIGAATIPTLASAQNSTAETISRVEKNKRGNGWKKLNLTDAQKAQLKTIRENAKTQRQAVFTPDQLAKLEQARKSGNRKGVWKTLNLTAAQKSQLKSIRETTKAQSKSVLTPEQQQQLAQLRQNRKANRGR